MIVYRSTVLDERTEPSRAPGLGRPAPRPSGLGDRRTIEHLTDPLGDQIANRASAAGRLDLESPVEGVIEIDRSFHESMLPS